MAETLGWPVGHLKMMVSSRELTMWACEFELRADDEREAEMHDNVNAEVQPGAHSR